MGEHGQSLGFALIIKQKEGSAPRPSRKKQLLSTRMQQSNCPATSAAMLQHEEDVTFVVLFLCFVSPSAIELMSRRSPPGPQLVLRFGPGDRLTSARDRPLSVGHARYLGS